MAPAAALLGLAPARFELHPGRGDVHGAERTEIEALGTAPTVGDQIDLAEPGPRIVPLREGADGDRLAEPPPRARDGGGPPREPRAGRRQQPGQRRAADLADQFVDVGGETQLAALPEAVEEFGHEAVEPMGADPPARLPQDLGGAGDAAPYSRGRPPGPGVGRGRGGRRNSRMAALRWMPVTATISSKSCRFSARSRADTARAVWPRTPAGSLASRSPPRGGFGNPEF